MNIGIGIANDIELKNNIEEIVVPPIIKDSIVLWYDIGRQNIFDIIFTNKLKDISNNRKDSLINTFKKGTTAQRPTGVQIGYTYKDTDLGKWIIWGGDAWENIDGSPLE